MKTIYAKITPKNWWVDAEICYKSEPSNVEIQVANKSFGDGLIRSVILFTGDGKPKKEHYQKAIKWVNDYLENAKEYGSDTVIDYEPQWKK